MKKKLSPYDISEDVVKVEYPEVEYKNEFQTRFTMITYLMAITWSGSQTFDMHGRPKDKDND